MKAIVQYEYGSADVLELTDIDRPVVEEGEVLVRVHAAGVHIGDWLLMNGLPYLVRLVSGLLRPKNHVPGSDVAGRVEAVGTNVKQFQPVSPNGHGSTLPVARAWCWCRLFPWWLAPALDLRSG